MRALAVLLASLLVVAPAPGQASRVRLTIMGHNAPVIVDSAASFFTIAASRGATFHAAAQAMLELKIAVNSRDSLRGMVGMANIAHNRLFARSPISRFLNCGSGMTGANADNWRVYITVFAFVDAVDSTSTTLRVAAIGGARDVAGTSTAPVACGSTGAFEAMFADRVKARLTTGAP